MGAFKYQPMTDVQQAAAYRFGDELEALFRKHVPEADERTIEAIIMLTQSIVCNRLEASGMTKEEWAQWAISFWEHNTDHKSAN